MKKLHGALIFLVVLTIANTTPLNRIDDNDDFADFNADGWTWVPTRSGIPIPLYLATAFSKPQLLFNVEDDVTFELYTLKNKEQPQILTPGNVLSVTSSNFNRSLPTRIYIHGWQEYGGIMKTYFNDAYLKKAKLDVNLIAVNWERTSHTLNYWGAARRVEPIGIYVAKLIDFLVTSESASLEDIHLIGFSLGAHVAGHAGKNVKSGKLSKIVGLDPAGPIFEDEDARSRLDKTDAKYVEIIHTCGSWLGIYKPVGTVNFYPNNGRSQLGWCFFDPTGVCSHLRAYHYYAESIYAKEKFWAKSCRTFDDMKHSECTGGVAHMGGEPGNNKNESSVYYLKTHGWSLFAKKWF